MNINVTCPINSLGYGVAAQNILCALSKVGEIVSLFPIQPWDEREIDPDKVPVFRGMEKNAEFYVPETPSVKIWHQNQLAGHVGNGEKIGFPFFELDRFTLPELHHIGNMDRMFVASHWAAQILEKILPRQYIHVVPLGVDRSIFFEAETPRLEADQTVFINVGKWEIRKGHDVLLEAFNKAFNPSDPVALNMICDNPFIGQMNDKWRAAYKQSKLGSKINFINRRDVPTQKVLARHLQAADCGVFPARAEGWNLDLLETLSCGKHAIATNYSAHTEYVSKDNCLLIDVNETEPAIDNIWFNGQGEWAKIDEQQVDQLIEHMRTVHRLKQTGNLGINKYGIETAKFFSWENSADQFVRGLL